jgi:hypothetical protein
MYMNNGVFVLALYIVFVIIIIACVGVLSPSLHLPQFIYSYIFKTFWLR